MTLSIDTPQALTEALLPVARKAGEAIMTIYATPFDVETKADSSPVTQADGLAEEVILAALADLTPDIPVIAEESVAAGRIPDVGEGPFWLVDPLDGTKEFIRRNGEFTVNIGLVVDRAPRLGVVHCPALGTTYWGWDPGTAMMADGETTRAIACRAVPAQGMTVLASRSHGVGGEMDDFLSAYTVHDRISAGSSLKFCRIAEGVADMYPRLGPTCEWDTCAAHAVLNAAGGSVRALDGGPLLYNKGGRFLNPYFIARGVETEAVAS